MNNKRTRGKTYHLVEQRNVPRPRDEVFEYAADFANSQEWDPGVDSSRQTSDGPVGVGTTYHLKGKFGPSTIEMDYEVVDFEPNRRVVLEGGGNGFRSRDEMTFSQSPDGTVITYTSDITLTNFLRFLGPLMHRPLERTGEKALDGLADSLQT